MLRLPLFTALVVCFWTGSAVVSWVFMGGGGGGAVSMEFVIIA